MGKVVVFSTTIVPSDLTVSTTDTSVLAGSFVGTGAYAEGLAPVPLTVVDGQQQQAAVCCSALYGPVLKANQAEMNQKIAATIAVAAPLPKPQPFASGPEQTPDPKNSKVKRAQRPQNPKIPVTYVQKRVGYAMQVVVQTKTREIPPRVVAIMANALAAWYMPPRIFDM